MHEYFAYMFVDTPMGGQKGMLNLPDKSYRLCTLGIEAMSSGWAVSISS